LLFVCEGRRSRRVQSAIQSERSEQFNTVPKEGLEPSRPKAQEPKSCVYTSSTTPAALISWLAKAARRGSCFKAARSGSRSLTSDSQHYMVRRFLTSALAGDPEVYR
jgi:hypothetical protein